MQEVPVRNDNQASVSVNRNMCDVAELAHICHTAFLKRRGQADYVAGDSRCGTSNSSNGTV